MRARVALAILLLVASAAFALEVPPPPTAYVTDRAGVLSDSDARALNDKLAAFEQRSGAQFIIYTFPSLEGEVLEDFTIRCAERWKVGNKKFDNGLILFVFIKDRKVRIEVGYGLEATITDAFSRRVIEQYIVPHFRQSDYAGGLNAAADALMAEIEHKEAPVAPVQPRARSAPSGSQAVGVGCTVLFWIAIILLILVFSRGRGCLWPLLFLGGGGRTYGGGGWSGGGGGGGFSGGGFSGGGGSFGGGGASGGW